MSDQSESRAVAIAPPRLPYHPAVEERFGVSLTEWRALVDAVFPLAKEASSVILALSYCRARKLDPFKKPVHIVPMWNSQLKRMVETVWPGIGELRTTAFRTGQYAGRDEAKYGETRRAKLGSIEIEYPEWCQVTVYRLLGGQRLPFPGPRVYWMESYATQARDSSEPNAMWKRRPFGQLDKCAEAAALRAAFPEEIGNEYAAEEMEGQTMITNDRGEPIKAVATVQGLGNKLDMIAGATSTLVDRETGEIIDGKTTSQQEDQQHDGETTSQEDATDRQGRDRESVSEAKTDSRKEPPAQERKPDAAKQQPANDQAKTEKSDSRDDQARHDDQHDDDAGRSTDEQDGEAGQSAQDDTGPTAADRERMEMEAELLSIAQTKAQKGARQLKLWLGSIDDDQLATLKRLEKQIAAYLPPDQKIEWPKR